MAKTKTVYFCTDCGMESPKWLGKCPACNAWNTFKEYTLVKDQAAPRRASYTEVENKPLTLPEVQRTETRRLETVDPELNRVLGGGVVPGSLLLLGGQPGIGKSTLILQVAAQLDGPVLYATGEESAAQIKLRADRLGAIGASCYIYAETNLTKIIDHANSIKPQLLIIDSIQTITHPLIDSTAGTISQVRDCAAELQRFAKETGIPVIIIGHITKDGALAGPKLLEHIVDVVLQFEGDRHYTYRLLRTIKNRYGSTDELGIYQMEHQGMRPVENPSELLISDSVEHLSGSTIAVPLEGQRPLLIETQALVSPAIYGNPQRSATGFDLRRLSMLLAVLDKRCGMQFGQQDVFLNIAGGIKIDDPAIDLAIVVALLSSYYNVPIGRHIGFVGEVGLSGEVRPVSRMEMRLQEMARLGVETAYIATPRAKATQFNHKDITIHTISKVDDLVDRLFH